MSFDSRVKGVFLMKRTLVHGTLAASVGALFFVFAERAVAPAYPAIEALAKPSMVSKETRPESDADATDAPEEFERFHREIRTRDGETGPAYPPNFKVMEVQKAVERKATTLNKYLALPWTERGPGNVGGRTRGLIVDPDDVSKNTWFAGSVSGGIWKTTDAGLTWVNKTPGLPNLATVTLAMAASAHNVIYAGTGEGYGNTGGVRGDGMWKSTDRGETWTQLPSTALNSDFSYVNRVIVDPADASVVLAATNSGIFRSTNGGSSWSTVYSTGASGGTSRIQQIIPNPQNFNILYATRNSNGVLKSYDRGLSWLSSSSGIGPGARCELDISPVDTARLFLAIESSNSVSDLYVSDDAGITWQKAAPASGASSTWLGTQGWYDNTIAAHPYDRDLCFVGGIDIYKMQLTSGVDSSRQRTTTRMTNWVPNQSIPYVHADHHNIAIIPVNSVSRSFRMLDGSDGGIGASTNGGTTWTNPNLGYNTSQFYGVDKRPGASQYVGGTQDNGTLVSASNPTSSSSWTTVIGGDGFASVWNYKDPNKVLGSLYYNDVRRSTNGGVSFASSTTDLTDIGSGLGPFVTQIGKSNSDPDLLVLVGISGVWRSDNFAENWTLYKISSASWGFGSGANAEISIADPQTVWAGIRMSNSGTTGSLHVSTDGGVTFSKTNNYSGTTLGRLSGIATHPTQPKTAYALFSFARAPKILRTTDFGQTWQDISGFGSGSVSTNGFPDVATYCLLVMPHNPNEIWVGTEIGLFISTNDGASWSYANDAIPAVSIWQLRAVDDEIVAATHGRGIWSVKNPALLTAPPPAATLSPRLNKLAQAPDGSVAIPISLRSSYDSTQVIVKGARYFTLSANAAAKDTVIPFQVVKAESLTLSLTSYRNGRTYVSPIRGMNVSLTQSPRTSYVDNFNSSNTNFTSNGFILQTPTGFSNSAYHSPHPYSNSRTYTLALNIPIIVQSSYASVRFDEIAIVEPGEPGSLFGSDSFYDYCIVEATKDGSTWLPLEDGYDARRETVWLNAWNSKLNGSPSIMKNHQMNLLSKFPAGTTVFVRFRMYADPGTTGWGWMIDNLEIQGNLVSVEHEKPSLPTEFDLGQNYPNPFNPSTTIRFQLPVDSRVTLTIFDALGRRVLTLVDRQVNAGTYTETWNATGFPSGVYFYRLDANAVASGLRKNFSETRRLLLVK